MSGMQPIDKVRLNGGFVGRLSFINSEILFESDDIELKIRGKSVSNCKWSIFGTKASLEVPVKSTTYTFDAISSSLHNDIQSYLLVMNPDKQIQLKLIPENRAKPIDNMLAIDDSSSSLLINVSPLASPPAKRVQSNSMVEETRLIPPTFSVPTLIRASSQLSPNLAQMTSNDNIEDHDEDDGHEEDDEGETKGNAMTDAAVPGKRKADGSGRYDRKKPRLAKNRFELYYSDNTKELKKKWPDSSLNERKKKSKEDFGRLTKNEQAKYAGYAADDIEREKRESAEYEIKKKQETIN